MGAAAPGPKGSSCAKIHQQQSRISRFYGEVEAGRESEGGRGRKGRGPSVAAAPGARRPLIWHCRHGHVKEQH